MDEAHRGYNGGPGDADNHDGDARNIDALPNEFDRLLEWHGQCFQASPAGSIQAQILALPVTLAEPDGASSTG